MRDEEWLLRERHSYGESLFLYDLTLEASFASRGKESLSQVIELMFFSDNTLSRRVRALLNLFLGDRSHVRYIDTPSQDRLG